MRLRLLMIPLLFAACTTHRVDLSVQAPATLHGEPAGYEEAVVVRAVDGDTIEVEVTARSEGPGAGEAAVGETHLVRLLGIDTPESVSPRDPVECFGREASAATAALLEGATVRLVKDVEERDGFDRLLRYVYLGAELANARLVANGYAHAYTYPPNVRHAGLLVTLEREARRRAAGLWAACGTSRTVELQRVGDNRQTPLTTRHVTPTFAAGKGAGHSRRLGRTEWATRAPRDGDHAGRGSRESLPRREERPLWASDRRRAGTAARQPPS